MALIFISYRRTDSLPRAARLEGDLATRFGSDNVFMDIEDIGPGADFVARLGAALGQAKVGVVVIGRGWNPETDVGRRLDNSAEFVRYELRQLFSHQIEVIQSCRWRHDAERCDPSYYVRDLAWRNAITLTDTQWKHDIVPVFDRISVVLSTPLTYQPAQMSNSLSGSKSPTRPRQVG